MPPSSSLFVWAHVATTGSRADVGLVLFAPLSLLAIRASTLFSHALAILASALLSHALAPLVHLRLAPLATGLVVAVFKVVRQLRGAGCQMQVWKQPCSTTTLRPSR